MINEMIFATLDNFIYMVRLMRTYPEQIDSSMVKTYHYQISTLLCELKCLIEELEKEYPQAGGDTK